MINEQELSDAVDRLRDGDDNGLLVKQEEVFKALIENKIFLVNIFDSILSNTNPKEYLDAKFESAASKLLREAYRTKLEQEAGL